MSNAIHICLPAGRPLLLSNEEHKSGSKTAGSKLKGSLFKLIGHHVISNHNFCISLPLTPRSETGLCSEASERKQAHVSDATKESTRGTTEQEHIHAPMHVSCAL